MEELKRCPFCGGEAVIRHGMISDDNIYMECVECGSCSGIFHTEAEAIAAWNRRVTQNIGKKECSVQDGRCTFDE